MPDYKRGFRTGGTYGIKEVRTNLCERVFKLIISSKEGF